MIGLNFSFLFMLFNLIIFNLIISSHVNFLTELLCFLLTSKVLSLGRKDRLKNNNKNNVETFRRFSSLDFLFFIFYFFLLTKYSCQFINTLTNFIGPEINNYINF